MQRTFLLIGLTGVLLSAPESGASAGGEWPQWRGAHRDGVSPETGLLKTWPPEGPETLWRFQAGEGFSAVSVAGGRAYTMFARGGAEYVLCLDAETGEEIWRFEADELFEDHQGGNGPRSTPAVDGDRVFALSARGRLTALNAESGQMAWAWDLEKEFGGKTPRWGFCASPLVEGELLLVETGGAAKNSRTNPLKKSGAGKTIAAFDKRSGDLVWTSGAGKSAYSSPIPVSAGGIRQIVFFTAMGLASVAPADGRIFWTYPWDTSYDVNAATPVFVPPDRIFLSSGYDKGASMLKLNSADAGVEVEEVWRTRVMKNQFSSSVLHQDHLYGFDNAILKCIEAGSGSERWRHRGFGKGTLIVADGHLIILGERGRLALALATPEGFVERASAQVLNGKCWTMPALAGGRLYLRNEEEIVCLDLKGSS